MSFQGVVKLETMIPKGIQQQVKSEPKAFRDRIFEIWARFWGSRILEVSLDGKIHPNLNKWGEKVALIMILGRSGGRGGIAREVRRV